MQILGRKRPILKHTSGVNSEDHTRAVVEEFDHQNNGALSVMTYTGALILNEDTTGAPATTYLGEAAPGSADGDPQWRIQKITVSGTIRKVRYAQVAAAPPTIPVVVTGGFDHIWTARAGLTYT